MTWTEKVAPDAPLWYDIPEERGGKPPEKE